MCTSALSGVERIERVPTNVVARRVAGVSKSTEAACRALAGLCTVVSEAKEPSDEVVAEVALGRSGIAVDGAGAVTTGPPIGSAVFQMECSTNALMRARTVKTPLTRTNL